MEHISVKYEDDKIKLFWYKDNEFHNLTFTKGETITIEKLLEILTSLPNFGLYYPKD